MEAEGQKTTTREELRFIHKGKTAAMIVASLRLGAMSANASPTRLQQLSQFGWNLGLAFQVIDDILDCTQTSAVLGKSAGKDVAAGKATYPALLGLPAAKKQAARLTREAISSLDPLGPSGELLRHLAAQLLQRNF
jgi:geranylgeranyl diphosphate synthase type II